MRRLPWEILLALLAGLGLGLVYAWMISPLRVSDAAPVSLRDDFKDHYRSAIAAAYAATGNLPRARARLDLLQESNPVGSLNAQAQRMLAGGDSPQTADQLAALAQVLDGEDASGEEVPASRAATEVVDRPEETAITSPAAPSPDSTFVLTETPPAVPTETQPAPAASTPPPTSTPVPTLSAPFTLTGQDEICDANLPEGLLQIIVMNRNRRQMPGMEIAITWEGGAEQFFTGLKPELGSGYADFIMAPNVSYTVQLASGSDIAIGLTAPTCQAVNGENFAGGIRLTFQQP